MRQWLTCFCVLLASHAMACADLVDVADQGFSLHYQTTIKADPETVYEHFVNVGTWWSSAHSWSGDSRNMKLELQPGGGFDEQLPNGGFARHMEVVYVDPGRLIRLKGVFGPLQELALQGAMSVKLRKADDQTVLEVTYHVSGYAPGGLKKWAEPVHQVVTQQFDRLKQRVEGTLDNSR